MSSDRVIDMAWSDIQVGMFIRWATPRFVKYGRVIDRKGNGMRAMFFDDAHDRAIPEAKWYFVEGKRDPHAEEHLVVIDYPHDRGSLGYAKPQRPAEGNELISVLAACELLKMDPKQMRRQIRRGVIPATKKDDRWVINREALNAVAAKNGWI